MLTHRVLRNLDKLVVRDGHENKSRVSIIGPFLLCRGIAPEPAPEINAPIVVVIVVVVIIVVNVVVVVVVVVCEKSLTSPKHLNSGIKSPHSNGVSK